MPHSATLSRAHLSLSRHRCAGGVRVHLELQHRLLSWDNSGTGSDTFLKLKNELARPLIAAGSVRLGSLAEHVNGVEAVREAVVPFAPERVAARCGIAAETMRELARTLAAAGRAAVYGRLGICTQRFGSLSSWLVNVGG